MRPARIPGISRLLPLVFLASGAAPLLAADGLDDPGGYASYGFDLDSAATDLAYGCAAQADGKIVLAGSATSAAEGGHQIAVTRLLLDGNPDPAFAGGRVVVDLTDDFNGSQGQARAVAVDPQGRILIAGSLHEGDFFLRDIGFVTRLLANGTIDDFWNNGYFAGWFLDGAMSGVTAMGFDSVGRLWTTGPAAADGTGLWRVQVMSDFGDDLDYGSIDLAPFLSPFATSMPTAIAFQPDGNVLIGGWVQDGAPGFHSYMVVVRLLGSTLELDPAFGFFGLGLVVIDGPSNSYLRSLALTPDLEIVASGEVGALGAEDVAVVGIRPNGTIHWGDSVGFDLGDGNGDGGGGLNRMVVQSDGKIVVAAAAYTGDVNNIVDIGVARTLPTLAGWDTTFGGNGTGKRSFDMPPVGTANGSDTLTCLTLSGGKAVVVGSARYSGTDWDFSLRRLTSDLIFAEAFESGTTWFWSDAAP